MTRRLLMVVNDAPFFLSHRLPIALAAQGAGYAVHIATPDHPRRSEIEQQGLVFHPFPLTRSSASPGSELGSLRALMAVYREVRPAIVHHVTHKPVLYGSMAARLTGVPAVVNAISGLGYAFVATGWQADLRRRLMLGAYRVAFSHPHSRGIFQNPEDVALFREAGVITAGQYILIPGSGVELDHFVPTPEPPGTPLIVLASRMLWDKGIGEFVEAARQLRSRGLNFRAALVGEPDPGNPRSLTDTQLRAWNDEGIVEWWGRRGDMAAVFASSSIACLPSTYREGVPKVLLEAAACGRPIVTTDAPGCRVVARPDDNGLLVAPGDAAGLATALERLLQDAALRARMGARSRVIAEAEFGIQSVVDATLALYASLHA